MTLEEFDRAIADIPKTKTNEAISAYDSINLDHLRDVVERFRKVPTYDELLNNNMQSNKEKQELIDYLKEKIKSLKNDLKGIKGQERYFLKQILSIYEEILNKIEKR